MLQFLRFDKSTVERAEFPVISGSESFKFFARRTGYLLILIYSTLFLAVAIPFQETYFIGGMIIIIFLVRFINHIVKYGRYKGGRIIVDKEGVEAAGKVGAVKVPSDSITYLEVNVLGNLVIREKYNNTAFPLMLLGEGDRTRLIGIFQDMAPKRTRIYRKAWDFFDAILVAFILAMHIRQYIVQAYFIPTGSMEDTLLVGDHLLVEKITYGPIIPRMVGMKSQVHLDALGLRGIRKGDIIIFRPPNEEEKDFIKRCIAVEGDEYHIRDGAVYVNGKKLEEPYTKGVTSYRGFSDKKIEGVVPKGRVIAMGDNRENSYDSRGFGYLPLERIKGRAFVLYWNTKQVKNLDFSRFGLIR